jgi:hypothetical protein
VPRWSSQEASAARWLQPCQVVLSAAAGGCCEAVSVVGYEGGCSGRGVGGASVAVLRCRHLARHGSGRALGQYTQADLSTARHHRHPRRDTPLKEIGIDGRHHKFFLIEGVDGMWSSLRCWRNAIPLHCWGITVIWPWGETVLCRQCRSVAVLAHNQAARHE